MIVCYSILSRPLCNERLAAVAVTCFFHCQQWPTDDSFSDSCFTHQTVGSSLLFAEDAHTLIPGRQLTDSSHARNGRILHKLGPCVKRHLGKQNVCVCIHFLQPCAAVMKFPRLSQHEVTVHITDDVRWDFERESSEQLRSSCIVLYSRSPLFVTTTHVKWSENERV